MKGVSGIIGMNILNEVQSLFISAEGMEKVDKYSQRDEAQVRRVLARVEKEAGHLGPDGRIGYVKIAGKQAITIPPRCEKVLEGCCGVSPRVKSNVLVEPAAGTSLPKGLLVAHVLAKTDCGKVPVRMVNLSEKAVRIAPRSRVASVYKPKEVVTKDVLEFEEDDGVLHVKELKQDQFQADKSLLTQPPVPVEVNYEGLTPAQCERLAELLSKHRDVFSRDDQDYGYTTAVVHDIPTAEQNGGRKELTDAKASRDQHERQTERKPQTHTRVWTRRDRACESGWRGPAHCDQRDRRVPRRSAQETPSHAGA
ncbi:hypothetical protein PGIGA_G00087930 [Pangasianodon gigas]|uniref:Uncharacterized protein n=1 Tax=Pangasianodon gigas TaxID=30993 RepID=A0ACC5XBJ1_PANGG|nr:hypothetical protein [Pangasianodon gigas]